MRKRRLVNGSLVRQLRRQHGFSQAELARRCGLSLKTIVNVENDRGGVVIWTALRLAFSLGVSARDLYQVEEGGAADPA